jgi:hypothetical protein
MDAGRALDAAAAERVLRRALELQAIPLGGEIDEAQLLALGEELGLEPHHVRQALAEERAGAHPPVAPGHLGPPAVDAARLVRGRPAPLLDALDAWLGGAESLRVERRFEGGRVWERRRGAVGSVQRGLNSARGHPPRLARAGSVRAVVVAVDEERCVVRLHADVAGLRRRHAAGGAVVGVAGAGACAVVAVAVAPVAVVAVPAAAGAGWLLARRHRAEAQRMEQALERALDAAEQPEARRRGLAGVLSRLARS